MPLMRSLCHLCTGVKVEDGFRILRKQLSAPFRILAVFWIKILRWLYFQVCVSVQTGLPMGGMGETALPGGKSTFVFVLFCERKDW